MARRSRRINAENNSLSISNTQYKVAIYARLSGNSKQKESESISNQVNLIRRYILDDKSMTVYREYIDEGYSGTNFKRPAFTEMLWDMQSGVVNCIIVKDLSRFGRDYIETGYYLEKLFPEMQVRFIALNDKYDSNTKEITQDFLLLGLKNLVNEMYAKDISKKVSNSYNFTKRGKAVFGRMPPYGYAIKDDRKEGLMVDRETAPVVEKIYDLYLQGESYHSIARILNESKIEPPLLYLMRKMGGNTQKGRSWKAATITNILSNPTYTGAVVRNKTKTSKFENKVTVRNVEEEWEIIPHMHEVIIHQDIYNKVRNMRKKLQSEK